MNLEDCYIEEDLFPKIFTDYEEREYGILFFNTDNKDSYDSNHAVIYKDKIRDLQHVFSDITEFYKEKGCRPIIYQSMLDDNWFYEIQEELSAAGFRSWIEDQEYMLQVDENRIIPNPDIEVRKVSEWSDGIENVFIEAEEPWEIKVAKKTLVSFVLQDAPLIEYIFQSENPAEEINEIGYERDTALVTDNTGSSIQLHTISAIDELTDKVLENLPVSKGPRFAQDGLSQVIRESVNKMSELFLMSLD